jgi:hypothetical protein
MDRDSFAHFMPSIMFSAVYTGSVAVLVGLCTELSWVRFPAQARDLSFQDRKMSVNDLPLLH